MTVVQVRYMVNIVDFFTSFYHQEIITIIKRTKIFYTNNITSVFLPSHFKYHSENSILEYLYYNSTHAQ